MEMNRGFFEQYTYCKDCRKLLPEDYEYVLCASCIEQRLFREVRDYIRTHDVTEYDVAEEFQLPVRRVKAWIKEGRIQYKQEENKMVIGQTCARCGQMISFGDFCSSCARILQNPKGVLKLGFEDIDASKMRYIDEEKRRK